MSKNYTISRNADSEIDENHWLKQLEKNLEKIAVQPRRIDQSLFDQINSVVSGNSKYPSVDAAVKDMQERSGLTAYLKNKQSKTNEDSSKKTASEESSKNKNEPELFKKVPSIKVTIENFITSTKGNISVPAILEKIRSVHRQDVSEPKDWEDDNIIIFISQMNLNEKKKNKNNYRTNEANLGKIDNSESDFDKSNDDAFYSLMPATH